MKQKSNECGLCRKEVQDSGLGFFFFCLHRKHVKGYFLLSPGDDRESKGSLLYMYYYVFAFDTDFILGLNTGKGKGKCGGNAYACLILLCLLY